MLLGVQFRSNKGASTGAGAKAVKKGASPLTKAPSSPLSGGISNPLGGPGKAKSAANKAASKVP